MTTSRGVQCSICLIDRPAIARPGSELLLHWAGAPVRAGPAIPARSMNAHHPDPPKILLIMQGDPRSTGVGELFVRELAAHYPPGRLVRYTLVAGPVDGIPDTWMGFPSVARPVEQSSLPMLSTWRQHAFDRRSLPRIADEIDRVVEQHHIDLIWIGLNSANTVSLAERLVAGRTPVVGIVWDDPEYLFAAQHLDPWTTRRALRRFAAVLKGFRRIAVASDGMAALYGPKYGVRGVVMIHGLHPSRWRESTASPGPKAEYTLGFAGSLYSKREWNALIAALDDWNRREPTRVQVRFIGRFPRRGVRREPFVETVGPLSLDETLTALASTDAAYVPYWFDRRHAWAARTAFPSKISAYVAAGTPVFYHGPRQSSPADFLQEYPVGLSCHSLGIADIQSTLRRLLFDHALRASFSRARAIALEERLGAEAFLRRFAELLGVDRAQLLPLETPPPGSQP